MIVSILLSACSSTPTGHKSTSEPEHTAAPPVPPPHSTPVPTNDSHTGYPGLCGDEAITPSWSPTADPCETLDGLLFGVGCFRMYFHEGWVYTFDRVGPVESARYLCHSDGTIARLWACSWNDDGEFFFDLATGRLASWAGPQSLVAEHYQYEWHSGTPTHEYYDGRCDHSGN